MTRRGILAGAAAAAAGVALAACGAPRGSRQGPTPSARGAATLHILYGGGGQAVLDLYDRTAFGAFKQRYPGSEIALDSSGNPMTKVLTLHAAGSAPDIIQGADTWTIDVAQRGLGAPLDTRTRRWPARTDFTQSAWESGQHETKQGTQWGLPLFVTARTVYLRGSVTEQIGAPAAPTTWEGLLDVARRSTKVENERVVRQGFTSPATDGWWYFFWLLQTTGATLYKEGKPAFGGGEGETVLRFMKDLNEAVRPTGAEPLAGADAANFTAGPVAHAWLHLAPYQAILESNPVDYQQMTIATPPVPGGERYRLPAGRRAAPLTFVDNALLFLSPQSKSPDHAWELSTLLLEGETLLEFNRLRGRLVPRKSLLDQGFMRDPKIREIAGLYQKHGRARFNPAGIDAITTAVNAVVKDVVADQKVSPQDGVTALTRSLEQIARDAGYSGTTRS
ncbi:MAG TPA: extracellular solute-binding protein [Chloroflexota bacterium]|nr:extracellular solute-binding protein [Chloroflexota bacterium]